MKRQAFVAAYDFICDRCGETVRAGEESVAEFDTGAGSCRMRHKRCPEAEGKPVRRPKDGPRKTTARRVCGCGRCTCRKHINH